jgi:hypothetical protein
LGAEAGFALAERCGWGVGYRDGCGFDGWSVCYEWRWMCDWRAVLARAAASAWGDGDVCCCFSGRGRGRFGAGSGGEWGFACGVADFLAYASESGGWAVVRWSAWLRCIQPGRGDGEVVRSWCLVSTIDAGLSQREREGVILSFEVLTEGFPLSYEGFVPSLEGFFFSFPGFRVRAIEGLRAREPRIWLWLISLDPPVNV